MLKSTFKVAAVTVEVLAAAINLTIAPIRALFALVGEVGSAIASALGVDGVNAAFELEKGFQSVLGIIDQVGQFIIGLGTRVGRFIGGIYVNIIEAGKTAATQIANIFGGTFGRIREFLANAYNNLPGPLKALIEGTINVVSGGVKAISGAATSFVGETIDAGKGFAPGSGAGASTQPLAATNTIQTTNNSLGTGTKQTKDEEAERLARIEKSNQDQVRALEQKTLLASALNAEEKQQFQRQTEIAEILRNEVGLNKEQLEAKLEATTNLYEQQDATKAIIEANKDRLEQEKEIKESGKEIGDLYKGIGNSIKSGVTDAIMGAIDGTKSLGEAASGILKNIGNQLISFGINSIFGGLGGGGGILGSLFGGGRASGGTVQGGRSYVVGEKGPELFTPGRTGSVAPNSSMGGNISVNVNVDASGSAVQGDGNESAQLGKAIGAAVQQELMKQKRPGGLLAGV